MSSTLRTTLYVDGFNLFYGAAKNTRLKWVNVTALAEATITGLKVDRTRYFTALVSPTPDDPDQHQKQLMYIRALETVPNLTVHYGRFQTRKVNVRPCKTPPDKVLVYKTEEKGSDVNLATYMLADAFRNECDQLVVITNDSDLEEPIRIINVELGKRVLVLNPHSVDTAMRRHPTAKKKLKSKQSYHLEMVASLVKDIRSHGNNCHMSKAQFPDTLTDTIGTITKPLAWV